MVMKNVTKKIQKIPYLLVLLLLSCLPTLAQNGVTVKGTVVDGTGETVIGASIVVKGNTSIGTISDIDGNFVLTVPNEKSTLIVSYVGMKPQEVKVVSKGLFKVVLEDDTKQLEEVVVVGYGQQKKAMLAYALALHTPLTLLDEPTNDIDVNTLRALEEGLENFAGCAVVISHDRWFLDRICTHILAFEGDSKVFYFEGSYSEYEENKKKRMGDVEPHRVRYRKLME